MARCRSADRRSGCVSPVERARSFPQVTPLVRGNAGYLDERDGTQHEKRNSKQERQRTGAPSGRAKRAHKLNAAALTPSAYARDSTSDTRSPSHEFARLVLKVTCFSPGIEIKCNRPGAPCEYIQVTRS